MSVAENIRKLRKKLCLNGREFAKELGIGASSISNYEMGRRIPSYPTIRKMINLAKKYKVTIGLDDIRPE